MRKGFQSVATRQDNAIRDFVANVCEQFGTSEEQARKVLREYVKAKAVKLDSVNGRYNLTHGAFWDREVIWRAVEL